MKILTDLFKHGAPAAQPGPKPNELETQKNTFASRCVATKSIQDAIKRKYPTREKAQAAFEKGGWSKRKDAIEALAYLGHDDDVLKFALQEPDAPAVTETAARVLIPMPFTLLEHMMTMKNGQFGLVLCYQIPKYNMLHIEKEVVAFLKPRKSQFNGDKIAACGMAYLRGSAELFEKHLKIDKLRTYADALAEGRAKDKPSLFQPRYDPRSCWDGTTERAVQTLIARRRMDLPVDLGLVRALRDQVLEVRPTAKTTHDQLTWVLFDAGQDAYLDDLLPAPEYDVRRDLATTFLKRGDWERFDALVATSRAAGLGGIYADAFCHWPLLDAQQARGHMNIYEAMQGSKDGYFLSRDAGVAPPPWWTWQAPWERSYFTKRARGEL